MYLIPLLYNCITGYLYPNSALQGIILVYYSILISLFQFCITGYLFTVFCRRDIFIPVFVAIPGLSGTLQSVTISSLSPPYLHPLRQLNNTKTQIHKYTNTITCLFPTIFLNWRTQVNICTLMCIWYFAAGCQRFQIPFMYIWLTHFNSIDLICDALLGGFYDEENWGYQIFQVLPACMIRSIRGATALQLLPRHMHPTKYL